MVNTLPEKERLLKYTAEDYYLPKKWVENQSWHDKTLRTDQLSVLAYSLGYTNYGQMCRQLAGLGVDKDRPLKLVSTYMPLIMKLGEGANRVPSAVVDIGCGRGELLLAYSLLGIDCIGIDPSPGAKTLVPITMGWENITQWELINKGMHQGLLDIPYADTIIMCESIEHVRPEEFANGWKRVCELLTARQGLFIVANWITYHPIPIDNTGYDHIRRIDDAFFDTLSRDAREVVFRQKSHLVLRF